MNTAEVSTQDVNGLHAKLQRKREVDLHNGEVQQSFAQRMENCYNSMQTSLQEQSHKHAAMIDYYRSSVGKMLRASTHKVEYALLGGLKSLPARKYLQENSHVNVCLCLSVGELLNTNGTVFKETLGAVCESYSSIKGAVGEGVERCKEQVLHQKKLSQEAQNSMLEILVRTP